MPMIEIKYTNLDSVEAVRAMAEAVKEYADSLDEIITPHRLPSSWQHISTELQDVADRLDELATEAAAIDPLGDPGDEPDANDYVKEQQEAGL